MIVLIFFSRKNVDSPLYWRGYSIREIVSNDLKNGKRGYFMTAIDLKKELGPLYKGRKNKPVILEVPSLRYITVQGKGHPSGKFFQEAALTIYPVAYTLKFMIREMVREKDFSVMPMEVAWKLDRTVEGPERFSWTMMILQPRFITSDNFNEAVKKALKKRELPCLSKLSFEERAGYLCGQIFHKGPYERMNDTFSLLTAFLKQEGYTFEKDSHDIYLNSIKRAKPENLKVLIRTKILL